MVIHIAPSQDATELASNTFETAIIESTQPVKARVLVLHTVGPANRAYLDEDGAGRLCLYFRGLPYGVDDYVPNSLLGSRTSSPSVTAGEFVCRLMLKAHGNHEDEWPVLARRFLMNHMTFQSGRSRSKR